MALTRRDLGRRAFAGAAAFGSHRELVEAHDDEKAWSVEFGVLQIWQKQDGQWKLLARQGWKT